MSQWAENERVLSPEASAEAGRWRNDRARHLVEPMNALSPYDPAQEITLKFCSQSGKTEVILNFAGFIMQLDPGPVLAIQPNMKPMAEAFSKDRVATMIRDTPALTPLVAPSKARDGENTIFHKSFHGGRLTIIGANSPAGLASRPIRYILADELDRWEITREGNPLDLARVRTRTYWNRKILKVSSPTYDGVGIDAEYQGSDQQFELHITCPDCLETQMPRFAHFDLNKTDVDASRYRCEHCGVLHPFSREAELKGSAHWVQVKDQGWRSKGYWMNQFGSPFIGWAETIDQFLKAKYSQDPEKLRVVVNTAFCEGWEEEGETVDETGLMLRREAYTPQSLPDEILLIVAAVDVQDDRLEVEVVGYGDQAESWGIEYRTVYGSPDEPATWRELDNIITQTYRTDADVVLGISLTLVDSGGHFTSNVYEYCWQRSAQRVYAIKGEGGENKAITRPTKFRWGKTQRAMRGFLVGVDQGKGVIYSKLRIPDPGPGYCHFPNSYDEGYFLMLTAEKAVTRKVKGFAKREWIKVRPRNEALDIRVYCWAALTLANPVWSRLKQNRTASVPRAKKPPPKRPAGKRRIIPR